MAEKVKMNKLNVLYMCDDGFAEIAGVSITSLFENNPQEHLKLVVYILGVNISKENQTRFYQLGKDYGQEIVLIDASEEYEVIRKMKLSSYRGSAMTNLRLHFDKLIPESVQRILYIDCDTIICDSLEAMCEFSMNEKLLAMAMDAYGKLLWNDKNTIYYNAGVLLIDCEKWRTENWREQIEQFIECSTENLAHPDQDVFNTVCREEIITLPMRYNLQVVHREYSEKLYFKHLAPNEYYSELEIENARKAPAIVHLVRVLGTNPWYQDGKIHPDYQLYCKYKEMSYWRDAIPKEIQVNFVLRCERVLKRILPKKIFFPISLVAIKMAMQGKNKNSY